MSTKMIINNLESVPYLEIDYNEIRNLVSIDFHWETDTEERKLKSILVKYFDEDGNLTSLMKQTTNERERTKGINQDLEVKIRECTPYGLDDVRTKVYGVTFKYKGITVKKDEFTLNGQMIYSHLSKSSRNLLGYEENLIYEDYAILIKKYGVTNEKQEN